MPYDAFGAIQTLTTNTATTSGSINMGSAYDLKTGTQRRGLHARFRVTALVGAGGSVVVEPRIQHSDTTAATDFTDLAVGARLTAGTGGISGDSKVHIPFSTTKRYVRSGYEQISGSLTSMIHICEAGVAQP